jgi:hypothetical protein
MSATCDEGGLLVGTGFPLPDDARVRHRAGEPPVGCNRLGCKRCGATVRHFDGVQLQRELLSGDEFAELWAARDAAAFPLLRAAVVPQIRFYFCKCFNFYTAGSVTAPSRDDTDWACTGHPS